MSIENSIDPPDRLTRHFFYRELSFMLLCSIVPLLLISALFIVLSTKNITKSNDENAQAHLVQVGDQMDMIVSELDSLNITFSVNNEILTAMTRSMILNKGSWLNTLDNISINYLTPCVASRSYIHSLYLYLENENGLFLSDAVGAAHLDTYFDTAWFETYRQHQNDKYNIYSELRSFRQYAFEKKDTWVITLYRPLFLRNGVVVLNLYKDYFDQQLAEQSVSTSQVLLVCNTDGEVLMQSKENFNLDDETLDDICTCDATKLTDYSANGVRYHIVRAEAEKTSWIYLSITLFQDLYSPLYSMVKIGSVATVALFIFCVLLSIRHANHSVTDIQQILQILNATEKHTRLPETITAKRNDIYSYILHVIVHNFAEQNNLRYQLQQKKYAARELELVALRAQINPHFLFNTLKTICWMSIEQNNGQNEVSHMIEDMTEILEYSMDSSDEMVPLSVEVHNTRAYLHIQSERYKDRFSIAWHCTPGVEDYYTIKLIIQPLIENSIQHGIRWEETENRPLHIDISIWEETNDIHIQVRDDGRGISPDQLEIIRRRLDAQTDEGHIGLYSCNRRLCLTFGEEYRLRIDSGEGYTVVSLRLPKMTSDCGNGPQ